MQFVGRGIGSVDQCMADTSLWVKAAGSDGRCYQICSADPSFTWEVSPSECLQSGVVSYEAPSYRITAAAGPARRSGDIVAGVPNWVLAVAALAVFLSMRN